MKINPLKLFFTSDPEVNDNGLVYRWSDRVIPRETIGENHAVDYELKSEVMEQGIDWEEKSISKAMYFAYKNQDEELIEELNDLWFDMFEFYKYKWLEARKVNKASQARTARLWNRIYAMMICGKCKFVTLTFTDKCLSSTDFKTRRTYVARFLKSQAKYYVANIDFGKQTEREHYHAIVMSNFIDFTWWEEHCGFVWVNTVPFSGMGFNEERMLEQAHCLSRYVNKLTNHAIKDTAKRNHIIYGKSDFKMIYNTALAEIINLKNHQ